MAQPPSNNAATFPQQVIVEGRYLGEARRTLVNHHGAMEAPYSYAFFCPVCADVWARCPVDFAGRTREWTVWSVACRKHPRRSSEVPGSLLLTWDKSFNDSLPHDALAWELERQLDHAERHN